MPRTGALYTPSHDGQAIAFVFENDDGSGPLSAGAVSIRELEELTELDFFPDMPIDRQESIESAEPNLNLWRMDYAGNFAATPTTFAGVSNHACNQLALRGLNGCGQGKCRRPRYPPRMRLSREV